STSAAAAAPPPAPNGPPPWISRSSLRTWWPSRRRPPSPAIASTLRRVHLIDLIYLGPADARQALWQRIATALLLRHQRPARRPRGPRVGELTPHPLARDFWRRPWSRASGAA